MCGEESLVDREGVSFLYYQGIFKTLKNIYKLNCKNMPIKWYIQIFF